jgi:hypothetical protein
MMTIALAAGDGCSRTEDLGWGEVLTLVDKGELGLFDRGVVALLLTADSSDLTALEPSTLTNTQP